MRLTELFHFLNDPHVDMKRYSHFEPTTQDFKIKKIVQQKKKKKKKMKEIF